MAEHADDWSAAGFLNRWERCREVVEMQSEAGRRALHGALHAGLGRSAL